ncbi:putative bactoprenol glycosyl transferase, phage origin [Oenococcus oeni]|uniref:glycosyltransferase family 2 protein n=1 Tax=Oenococcus oeni TaxID=1247 RepID=UPI00107996C7|nr:glycosyltransferase family 2 protein [Oenococcus oeni]AVI94838.1 bactoprenol glucosyl transferase [Oenococcus oeni]SYV98704.1 putative bactoprenol glycosyl transferase, phage origin [Oenococcus oeni]SYW01667.1 putative bactoprenol glycosyl transferase, phage origin [Oenococcus oeni]SYW17946.1 putative bactoprenol glycosyl transferase, phage origin [Oenococcus oeni]VDC15457.1 putative bactoprenol glycosyl transferase, phage origin [Oenococcus oeni]
MQETVYPSLAIIVPVHNEEENIHIFYNAVKKNLTAKGLPSLPDAFKHLKYDFWYIDDGSIDRTLLEIKQLQLKDSSVHFVSFSRNFGKEAAIYAGLTYAKKYDYVVLMDVDLQDPPALLPKMLGKLVNEQLDSVATRRLDRKGEKPLISFFSNLFYEFISKISSTKLVSGARDYRIMSRQMVQAVLSMPENQRFSKGLFTWIGFRTEYISYKNVQRKKGQTKWSFWKLFKYAISALISFSTVPLTLVTVLGFLTTLLAVVGGIFVIVRKLLDPAIAIGGWTTITVIIMFFGGLQMFSLGVVGRYISAIFLESKRRPIYVEKESK